MLCMYIYYILAVKNAGFIRNDIVILSQKKKPAKNAAGFHLALIAFRIKSITQAVSDKVNAQYCYKDT